MMIPAAFWSRLWQEIKNLVPLFKYLILQTETHAFSLALACAALIGFFPSCLVVLSILDRILGWKLDATLIFPPPTYKMNLAALPLGFNVLIELLQGYFLPGSDQTFVARNLITKFIDFRGGSALTSVLWVLVGAAGVFVPLEAGLNRLWKVREDRPYWKNQIVGFGLTLLCTILALIFVLSATGLHWLIAFVPTGLLRQTLNFSVNHLAMTLLLIVCVFALYKVLPNTKIDAMEVLPAAVLAGVLMEIVRLLYFKAAPNLDPTQGPFAISVTFLILAYIETFVVLGCAFLASQRDRYSWIGFLARPPVATTPPAEQL